MIRVKLYGGLGNQMFQYATAAAAAERNGTKVMLDLSWFEYELRVARTKRVFELDIFDLGIRKYNSRRLARRVQSRLHRVRRIEEQSMPFDDAVVTASGNVYLDGYWQSEKYFVDAVDRVRSDFAFPKPADPRNVGLLLDIAGCPTATSVHVRRGDYVTDADTNVRHGLAELEYYEKAAALISSRIDTPRYYVFSDDPAWCRRELRLGGDMTIVDWNTGTSSFEDMRLMSNCKHHIIANSSFSWWGAWLNPRSDKVVVAPDRWFRDPSVDTSDVIPDTWTRL